MGREVGDHRTAPCSRAEPGWHGDAEGRKVSELREFSLGAEGLRYVASHLSWGHAFSKCVLERVDLSRGEVFTHLPPAVPTAEVVKFDQGGKLPTPPQETWRKTEGGVAIPIPSTRPHLVQTISGFLSGPGSVCVLENADASRSEPWLERCEGRLAFFGDEVYHVLEATTDEEAIDVSIRRAQSLWTFVGALTSLGNRLSLPDDRGELTQEIVDSLAERVEQVFVGAYDLEGYVIWSRPKGERALGRPLHRR